MTHIPDSHRDIIEKSQVVMLGTIAPKSGPQVTALWFYFDGDTLKMSLNDSRQKVKNLRLDPRASAFFIDPESPYRTIELRGTVSINPDPDYEFASKVGEKYNADMRQMDQPGETRSVVTLQIDRVLTFGE